MQLRPIEGITSRISFCLKMYNTRHGVHDTDSVALGGAVIRIFLDPQGGGQVGYTKKRAVEKLVITGI